MKHRTIVVLAMLLSLLDCASSDAQGNHPADLFIGLGFPEMFNGGLAIQMKQAQVMIGVGYM